MSEISTKPDLVRYIREEYAAGGVGSATKKGMLYQEIPFPGYESIPAQRQGSDVRLSSLLEHVDVQGKQVLDIGCNVGFFCFELARRGARSWGLDHDQNSLVIANALKRIHDVEGASFHHGRFSVESLRALVADAGHFDIVILNSVIHWLIQETGSVRRVLALLNRIPARRTQFLVYEPSSTNKAYAPEQLEHRHIMKFFSGYGADRVRRIARNYVTNARTHREYWLGEKDPERVVTELDGALGEVYQASRLAALGAGRVYEKRDKIAFRYKGLFLKTVKTRHSPFNMFLENEAATAARLMEHPEVTPLFVESLEKGGRRFLVYEALDDPELDLVNTSRDVVWITKELRRIGEVLASLGIVHNDIRAANILAARDVQELRLIDFEFSDRDVADVPPDPETYSPLVSRTTEERAVLDELLPILKSGGPGRGTGAFSGDVRALEHLSLTIRIKQKPGWRVALRRLGERLR